VLGFYFHIPSDLLPEFDLLRVTSGPFGGLDLLHIPSVPGISSSAMSP
jgi:hypothetical protein